MRVFTLDDKKGARTESKYIFTNFSTRHKFSEMLLRHKAPQSVFFSGYFEDHFKVFKFG